MVVALVGLLVGDWAVLMVETKAELKVVLMEIL
jgi:hypothetical protein